MTSNYKIYCCNLGKNRKKIIKILSRLLTCAWSQQVSELLLITGMNKVENTLTQQIQLSITAIRKQLCVILR